MEVEEAQRKRTNEMSKQLQAQTERRKQAYIEHLIKVSNIKDKFRTVDRYDFPPTKGDDLSIWLVPALEKLSKMSLMHPALRTKLEEMVASDKPSPPMKFPNGEELTVFFCVEAEGKPHTGWATLLWKNDHVFFLIIKFILTHFF